MKISQYDLALLLIVVMLSAGIEGSNNSIISNLSYLRNNYSVTHPYQHDAGDNVPPIEFFHGTTTLSFAFKDGIVCAVDSRASLGNFVGSKTTQKVLPISSKIIGTMAGGAADCTYFLRMIRAQAKLHSLQYSRPMSVTRASRILATELYQNPGLSMGTMIMGFENSIPIIYYIDNTGLRLKGDVFAVGSGSSFAMGILDDNYHHNDTHSSRESRCRRRPLREMNEVEAIELARTAIRHATYRDAYSGGFVGIYVVREDGWKKVYSQDVAAAAAMKQSKYQ